jgi:uncharacterized surface protein with fasciclin (FAS1) repeats
MKKTLFAAGLAALAVTFAPAAGVSAHGYDSDYEGGRNSDTQTASWHEGTWDNNDWNDGSWSDKNDYQDSEGQTDGTIVDALVEDGNFTTLVAAVQAAGLADTLSAPGELTVFAPTDEAFAKLPAGTVETLLADVPTLTKILTNHVVAGSVDGDTAVEVGEATALSGTKLNIGYGDDGVLYVNDSAIEVTDIMTSNGIVHVIDAVIVE